MMRTHLLLCFCLLATYPLQAVSTSSTYEQLATVNAYWISQPQSVQRAANAFDVHSADDRNLIQLHLQLVEQTLRNRILENITPQQYANRLKGLDYLHQYWNINRYPVNSQTCFRNPVFIDQYQTFCAVGFLMKSSGNEYLARRISNGQNLSYLRHINVPGLQEWIANSGFTVEELAWIQPGYLNINYSQSLGKGVDGPVFALAAKPGEDLLYVGGAFRLANNQVVCNNIVAIQYDPSNLFNNTFTAVGSGFNGSVKTVFHDGTTLYAGGQFDSSGSRVVNGIAKFNGTEWEAMGALNGAVHAITQYQNKLVIGGNFSFVYNGQTYRNLAMWDANTWKPLLVNINDEVNALISHEDMLFMGGAFTEVDTVPVKYVCAYDNGLLYPTGTGLETPVYTFSIIQDSVYAAGQCASGDALFGIAKYHPHGNWEYLTDRLNTLYLDSNSSIRSIAYPYIGGKFIVDDGRYGSTHTGMLNNATFKPFASPNGPVNAILKIGKRVFFGGTFDKLHTGLSNGLSYQYDASNLAVWEADFVGLEDIASASVLRFSPNPVTEHTTISVAVGIRGITITDMQGKEICSYVTVDQPTTYTLERSDFPHAGLYVAAVTTADGNRFTQKLLLK